MLIEVEELAAKIGATALGEAGLRISELKPVEEATAESICPLLLKKFLKKARIAPGAVLATAEMAGFALESGVRAAVVHDTPLVALARLIDLFHPEDRIEPGIHPSAVVHETAVVHPTATIGPNAVVGARVELGESSSVGPCAVICADTRIGRGVVIGPGAVIGHEGFGFAPGAEGPLKIRHVGRVVIEDFVEIGANTCIDRATLGTTFVGRSSKLDNLVQVGHNATIGRRALIAGQAGLAGSAAVGDDAMLGGKVGIADHVTIGARAKVAAGSGVSADVADEGVVAGYPAVPRAQWLKSMAWLARAGKAGGK